MNLFYLIPTACLLLKHFDCIIVLHFQLRVEGKPTHIFNTFQQYGARVNTIPLSNDVIMTSSHNSLLLHASLTSNGVLFSLIRLPSNTNLIALFCSPCRSQYALISFFNGVFFLILKCTTEPSCKEKVSASQC